VAQALERQDPEEVAPAEGYRVANVVFDATPLQHLTALVTEEGPLRPSRLRALRREVRGFAQPGSLTIGSDEAHSASPPTLPSPTKGGGA